MQSDNQSKAIVYCRVSDPKQVTEGHGLESQETRCREFAKNRGYEVVATYHERGITGKLMDRPQIQSMLKFLRSNKNKEHYVVIIDDISRLARDIETHIQLRTAISATGAKLESPSIEFGEDSDSRLVEHLLASVAAHQREKNAETTKNRMRARAMNGYWVAHAPVGYRYEKRDGHGKMLVQDEPVASIVQEALTGFAHGRFETQSEVQRFLETHAAYPKDRKGRVHFQRVKELLNRVLYAGRITLPGWGIHNQPGKHEALISFEEWTKIQKRLNTQANAPIRKDVHQDFPLRNFVTCSCCEAPMTAGWTKGRNKYYGYYVCQKKGCDFYGKSIKKDHIEGEFEKLLKGITPPKPLFDVASAMFRELWDERSHNKHKEIFAIKKEKGLVERKIGNLLDRVIDANSQSLITAYEQKIKELEESKVVLDEKIANCGRALPSFEDHSRTAMKFLENPYELWASDALEDRRNVLKLCFTGKLCFDKNEGFRTVPKSLPFRVLEDFSDPKSDMVPRRGLEPPHPKAHGPEPCASTNSAIWALSASCPRRQNVGNSIGNHSFVN